MKASRKGDVFHIVSTSLIMATLLGLSACSLVPKPSKLNLTTMNMDTAVSFSAHRSQRYLKAYAVTFLPAGHTIMAPTAFLEMCERSPIDCKHSRQTSTAAVAMTARTALLAKLDRVFSGDSLVRETSTAAIKSYAALPPVQDHTALSYASVRSPDRTETTTQATASTSADSQDISGSDPGIAGSASLPDVSNTIGQPIMVPSPETQETLNWTNKPVVASITGNNTPISPATTQIVRIKNDNPAFAQSPDDYLRINFDVQVKSQVGQINDLVNQTLIPDTDAHIYKVADYWNAPGMAPGTRGDCEDYALEKRRLLIQTGIPADSLSLAIVKTPDDIEHVVLILSTLQGDMVLDNLHYTVKDWRKTDYTWVSRQSALDDLSWVSLDQVNAYAQLAPSDTQAINQ